MTSWVPDYSIEAPERHTWMRPTTDCPDCQCCSAELCKLARLHDRKCIHYCSDKQGQMSVRDCPCCVLTVDEKRAVWTRITVEQGYVVRHPGREGRATASGQGSPARVPGVRHHGRGPARPTEPNSPYLPGVRRPVVCGACAGHDPPDLFGFVLPRTARMETLGQTAERPRPGEVGGGALLCGAGYRGVAEPPVAVPQEQRVVVTS
jgi:hypothetical protein